MSTEIIHYCDKCDKKISENKTIIKTQSDNSWFHEEFDLCSKCYKDVINFIGVKEN